MVRAKFEQIKKLFRRTIIINNKKFSTPFIRSIIELNNCQKTESWMMSLLPSLLTLTTGTVIDVGVNLGQTLVKVKACDPARSYIGFEPNPYCRPYIQALIKKNSLTKCKIISLGLAEKSKSARLILYGHCRTTGQASIDANYGQNKVFYDQIPVKLVALDQWLIKQPSMAIGLIKIDTEGGELLALKGMIKALTMHQPLILIEIIPAQPGTAAIRRNQKIFKFLTKLNYQIWQIEKLPDRPTHLANLHLVSNPATWQPNRDPKRDRDYLAGPKHLADTINKLSWDS